MPGLPSSTVVMARIESMSLTSTRPRISWSVRGSRSAMGVRLSVSGESGEEERAGEAASVVGFAEVEVRAGGECVGEDDAGHPLGSPGRTLDAEVGFEPRRTDRGGAGQDLVEAGEGQ